jgi:hypothetical protein
MPRPVNIIIGEKYNKLTVIREDGLIGGRRAVFCRCECGKEIKTKAVSVFKGRVKSCGCILKENSKTHGMFGTELYRRWADMKNRCLNSNVKAYKYYGGRGIKVCDAWLKFEAFMEWANSNGYQQGLSLERNNPDGNYEPGNCKWIPLGDQQKNKRSTRYITINGETKILQDWCNQLNIPQSRVSRRIGLGWPVEKALLEPVNTNNNY